MDIAGQCTKRVHRGYATFVAVCGQVHSRYWRRRHDVLCNCLHSNNGTRIIETISTMSAKQLTDNVSDGIPNERVFQYMFNEAINWFLPLNNYVIPEFNTFAVDSTGNPIHEELDFYIGGNCK